MAGNSNSGRRRKPVELHQLEGTKPDYKNELMPVYDEPNVKIIYSPPQELDNIAKKWWRYHAPILSKARVLTEADVSLLQAAAERWSVYCRAAEMCQKALIDFTKDGNPMPAAQTRIASQALTDYLKVAGEFGIGAASRTKVMAPPPIKEKNEFEEMFS